MQIGKLLSIFVKLPSSGEIFVGTFLDGLDAQSEAVSGLHSRIGNKARLVVHAREIAEIISPQVTMLCDACSDDNGHAGAVPPFIPSCQSLLLKTVEDAHLANGPLVYLGSEGL